MIETATFMGLYARFWYFKISIFRYPGPSNAKGMKGSTTLIYFLAHS